jgi:hypothetical protein
MPYVTIKYNSTETNGAEANQAALKIVDSIDYIISTILGISPTAVLSEVLSFSGGKNAKNVPDIEIRVEVEKHLLDKARLFPEDFSEKVFTEVKTLDEYLHWKKLKLEFQIKIVVISSVVKNF